MTPVCTYCGREGHSASNCPRREREYPRSIHLMVTGDPARSDASSVRGLPVDSAEEYERIAALITRYATEPPPVHPDLGCGFR